MLPIAPDYFSGQLLALHLIIRPVRVRSAEDQNMKALQSIKGRSLDESFKLSMNRIARFEK
jgi:hypothetical protein